MKKIRLIAMLIALTLVLTACGNKLAEGVIIDKEYTPSRTIVQYIWTGKMLFPCYINRPAQYRICVQGPDEEGTIISEWWDVDPANYSRLQIGMRVSGGTNNENT